MRLSKAHSLYAYTGSVYVTDSGQVWYLLLLLFIMLAHFQLGPRLQFVDPRSNLFRFHFSYDIRL